MDEEEAKLPKTADGALPPQPEKPGHDQAEGEGGWWIELAFDSVCALIDL